MTTALLSALALFSTLALSSPISRQATSNTSKNGICTSFTLPIPVTVSEHIYDLPPVDSQISAASFEVAMDTWNGRGFPERIEKNVTFSKTFDIWAQLCIPPNGAKKDMLQIATHGGGFDHRYWNVEVSPSEYNYVDAVLEAGYSILIYDRLTVGQSYTLNKPDGYKEGQLPTEVEILHSMTSLIKSGALPKYASNAKDITFSKYIHIGHSLGSITTYTLATLYPDLSDAIVLTGFIPNEQFYHEKISFQDQNYAAAAGFPDRQPGYTVPGTPNSLQVGFFSTRANSTTGLGGFEPELLDYAWSIRQPQTVTEYGSGGVLLAENPVSMFKGPVQLVAGEYDFTVCLGDCAAAYDPKLVEAMFPASSAVDVYLQPGTGHGLPFHKGAQVGFKATFDWLAKNGL